MRQFFYELKNFWRKGDLVLLLLCVMTSAYGCLVIASTTNYRQTMRYVLIQAAAIVLGVVLYIIVSSVNADFISEHRVLLVGFTHTPEKRFCCKHTWS